MIEFTKEELGMIVDALQYTSCCDVNTNIESSECVNMAKLSVKIAKDIKYKSNNNKIYGDEFEEPKIVGLIKKYLNMKKL